MAARSKLYCSFCGKAEHEVRQLISGPSVYICNECVTLCTEIIVEKTPGDRTLLVSASELLALRAAVAKQSDALYQVRMAQIGLRNAQAAMDEALQKLSPPVPAEAAG
jgi:uncharacterized Zn finger protein